MKDWLLAEAIGDISGVPYEFRPERDVTKIDLMHQKGDYSDDTVCTFALAACWLENVPYEVGLRNVCRAEQGRGYGGSFRKWIIDGSMGPYGSWGNGSAMRVSHVPLVTSDLTECARLAAKTAEITHDHPEGIKGAVIAACASKELMEGASKDRIREAYLGQYPKYADMTYQDLWKSMDGKFHVSCQKTLPEALICFLDSKSYQDCIKKCISLGSDADTLGAIAGPWAYAFYREIPEGLLERAKGLLPEWMHDVNNRFNEKYGS